MQVTVTLTPEQVLQVLRQHLEVNVKTPEQHSLELDRNDHGEAVMKVKQHLDGLPTGSSINVAGVAKTLKVPNAAVSTVIATLKRIGKVEMVIRGTWMKL